MVIQTRQDLRAWHIAEATRLRKYEVALRSIGEDVEANELAIEAELHESAAEVLKEDK